MTPDSVTLPLALVVGAVSFLSPCVLPLVPVYVSYLVRSSPPRDPKTQPELEGSTRWRLSQA